MVSIRSYGRFRRHNIPAERPVLPFTISMSTFKKIIQPVIHKDTWKMYFLWTFLASTWFYFDIYTVWIFKKVGDAVELWIADPIKTMLIWYCIVFVIFYIRKFLIRKKLIATARYELAKHLWWVYMKKFFNLDYTYVEKIGTWRIIEIMQTWINSRIDLWCTLQVQIPNVIIKLWFTLVLLYIIWPLYFTIFIVTFILLQIYVNRINTTYTAPLRRKRKAFGVQATRHFVRVLMSKQEVVQADNINYEINKYKWLLEKQKILGFAVTKFIYFMFNVPIIIAQCVGVCIIVYAYITLQDWTFSLGMFSALLWMTWFLTQLMITTTDNFKKWMDWYTHIEKLWNMFEEAPVWRDISMWKKFSYKNWSIQIQNLWFSYEWNKPVFTDFSLSIAWWKKTALVGMSWAWKSTLVKIIAWYLSPTSWTVNVDWQNLSAISLASYYNHVWFLTQEPNVFDGTIKENMLYAVSEKMNEHTMITRIETALKGAQCDFIFDFPDWINTEIWERGVRLSWWQRQRLAIAKILLKDPQIVILDEPTSALDSFSEESITKAMHRLFEWRTVIIIAHRLQTVKEADSIIVLWYDESAQSSKIIEQGNHKELVAKWWFYARMLEVQTGF